MSSSSGSATHHLPPSIWRASSRVSIHVSVHPPPVHVTDSPLETDGYCPADDFPNIFFFGIMSGLYLFFGLGWLVACTLHRFSPLPPVWTQPPLSDELIYIQHWITTALALGMIETTLLFSYYLDWNENGIFSVGLLAAALLFGVTKRAVSRIVILVIPPALRSHH